MTMKRRTFLRATVGATAAFGGFQGKAWGQAKAVRIGYTLSATGPYAVGAGIIQAPNYALWLDQLNSKGGIMAKGEGRRPVEHVSIDDRSEHQTAVRFYADLMPEDNADVVLPPWGPAKHFVERP